MDRKSIWQASVSIFMIAFGVFALWVMHEANRVYHYSSTRDLASAILTYSILALIVGAGLWGFVLAIWDETDQEVPGFLLAYAGAWRKIISQKWLLWVIGGIVLIEVIGSLPQYFAFLMQHFDPQKFSGHAPVVKSPWVLTVSRALSREIGSHTWYFFARIDPGRSSGGLGVATLIFSVLVVWMYPRLQALEARSEYKDSARFIRSWSLPIALVSVIGAAGYVGLLWVIFHNLAAARISGSPYPLQGMIQVMSTILQVVCEFVVTVLFGALLTGGLAGSLLRLSKRESISGNSFLEDAVKSFKPLGGLFLFLFLVWEIFQLPGEIMTVRGMYSQTWWIPIQVFFYFVWRYLGILLMFAPFIIISGSASLRQGLLGSLRIWKNCGYNLMSFVAVGLTGITIVMLLKDVMLPRTLGVGVGATPPSILFPIPFQIVMSFISVFVFVAVWEFYQQIRAFEVEDRAETLEPAQE